MKENEKENEKEMNEMKEQIIDEIAIPLTTIFSGGEVSIDMNDGVAVIDLRICVKSNVRIPELAKKVQTAVKEAVQNMTGIVVSRVNLHIAGVEFETAQSV